MSFDFCKVLNQLKTWETKREHLTKLVVAREVTFNQSLQRDKFRKYVCLVKVDKIPSKYLL